MKYVGVVVEGPSDSIFWKRFFGKMFSRYGYVFDVCSMKGCSRVIQEAPNLVNDFHKAGYHSVIIILDADKSPCATAVMDQFDESIRLEARQPNASNRFVNIFVALRELESWVLADEECIQNLLGLNDYCVPSDQAVGVGKRKFLRICRDQGIFPAGLEDMECARQAAGFFDPHRAIKHSASFAYFWSRVNARLLPTAA